MKGIKQSVGKYNENKDKGAAFTKSLMHTRKLCLDIWGLYIDSCRIIIEKKEVESASFFLPIGSILQIVLILTLKIRRTVSITGNSLQKWVCVKDKNHI